MVKNKNADAVLFVVLKGTATCMICLLLGLMALAKAVEMEWITEESMGYGIMLLLIISSYVGSAVTKESKTQNKLMVCTATALTYYVSLIFITLLFFHGKFNGLGVTALLIICGSILPMLTKGRRHRDKRRVKKIASNW